MNIDDIIDSHMTVTDPLLRTAIRDVCLLVADAEREACARIADEVASRLEPGAAKFYVASVGDFIRNRGIKR